MKFFTIAAAMAGLTIATPSQAAFLILQGEAFATGTVTVYNLNTSTVREESRWFKFDVDASDLEVGQSRSFSFGPSANAGTMGGTITRIGFDLWGNQSFEGSGFQFNQFQYSSDRNGGTETRLTASTFKLRQVAPSALPEPGTWLTMILGFGLVGYAMRRRTVLRFI